MQQEINELTDRTRTGPHSESRQMKAVIMAGGQGTRLRPLTSNAPKPMMPLANRPMMEHIIDLLKRYDINEIVVTVAFMANAIRSYFGDGSEFGVQITYATEDTPLGTAGSVRNAMGELDDTFLVISGDVLTDIDLGAIVAEHKAKNALATIGLVRVEDPLEYGIVITDEDGTIERFLEKPTWGQVFSDTINSGIYVLEPEVFNWIEPEVSVDFSSDVFPKLLEDGRKVIGAVSEGYWEDVGTLQSYLRAHKDILDSKVEVEIAGFEISDGVWLGEGAEVHPEAKITSPAVIGDNCYVAEGVQLRQYSVLGAGVRVRRDSELERTVVQDNAHLGEQVRLRGTVVGRSCDLRRGVRCEDGVVIGDEVFVGEDSVISADVKIYPFKTIESGAVINTSLIWESKGSRSLFGRLGVTGLANVDATPELAAKVALAYATSLPRDSSVIVSRDTSRAARMLKRAFIAGLNSGGVNVFDLEVNSVPVTRFHSRSAKANGGVSLRLTEEDSDSVVIRFFDRLGADISEAAQRKIERLFGREDFRRVRAADIGQINLVPSALEMYALSLEQAVDIKAINERRFKLVLDYAFGSSSLAMPNVLSKLGAEVLAVNPFASTLGVLGYDRLAHAQEVANYVTASGADLGAVIDPSGDQLTLVDNEGSILDHTEQMLCFLELIGDQLNGDKVALPVNAPSAAAALVEGNGYSVSWSQTSAPSLMAEADRDGVGFAANLEGGVILPESMPAFDAAAGLLKVMDMLTIQDKKLSEVVDGLPHPHLTHDTVVTPWDDKGTVMRSLVEQTQGSDVELLDGVKVFRDEGWVLILPDPEEPVTHVWAEGNTSAEAKNLVQEYSRRIRQLIR